jgi:GntR family transcriptional repressor for pyruvate dehydrogenase complex
MQMSESLTEAKVESTVDEDSVVRLLIEYIGTHGLRENDRVPAIREFAELQGVNASVVRSGYLRAETIGIIRMHQRSGAFVQRVDFERIGNLFKLLLEMALAQSRPKIIHFYNVRTIIEAETCRIAARRASPEDLHQIHSALNDIESYDDRDKFVRADEQFHLAIASVSGNPILVTILESIFSMMRPHRMSLNLDSAVYEEVRADHAQLYNALLEHDEDAAARYAMHHSDRRKNELLSVAMQKL